MKQFRKLEKNARLKSSKEFRLIFIISKYRSQAPLNTIGNRWRLILKRSNGSYSFTLLYFNFSSLTFQILKSYPDRIDKGQTVLITLV